MPSIVLAPVWWVERASGWKRLLLVGAYLMTAGAGGLFAWRATSLNGLPDAGDPFDVKAFVAKPVPSSHEDAFPVYAEAVRACRVPNRAQRAVVQSALRGSVPWTVPAIRSWSDRNGEALRIWRRGAARPSAYDPMRESFTPMCHHNVTVDGLLFLAWVAAADAARRQDEGDMAGAWENYRDILRSSRHVGMHGSMAHRRMGLTLMSIAHAPALKWAADPRVDAAMLRRAVDDAWRVDAMTARPSEALKAQYLHDLAVVHQFGESHVLGKSDAKLGRVFCHLSHIPGARSFVMREPDRSRRVVRAFYANRLAFCDLPPSRRPSLVGVWVYDPADAPSDARGPSLSPAVLSAWLDSSMVPTRVVSNWMDVDLFDQDERLRAAMIVGLAEQWHVRVHGKRPARPELLVGPCLDRLPEAYEPVAAADAR